MFKSAQKVTQFLGLMAGSLSLVLLIKHGWDFGLASVLRVVLDFYEALVRALLGWAEAPIKDVLRSFRHWIGVDLHLYPYWKHMFVLMWLYFSGIAKTYWAQRRDNGTRRIDGMVFFFVWGGFVALISSVASGTVVADGTTANILVMAFPIAGFVTFEIGRSIWGAAVRSGGSFLETKLAKTKSGGSLANNKEDSWWFVFRYRMMSYALPNAVFGGLSLALGLQFAKTNVHGAEVNPNILTLISFVVGLILYWFGRGLWLAVFNRKPKELLFDRFFRSGAVQFGVLMLTVLMGATIFIALNAGLMLAGP